MNRRNRLRGAAILLALFVVAAIVTGVAASATTTAVPKQLTGWWKREGVLIWVGSSGTVTLIPGFGGYEMEFSRVTAHRLTVSGSLFDGKGGLVSCSGTTDRYRWKVASHQLKLTKIHDACRPRVNMFAGVWGRTKE